MRLLATGRAFRGFGHALNASLQRTGTLTTSSHLPLLRCSHIPTITSTTTTSTSSTTISKRNLSRPARRSPSRSFPRSARAKPRSIARTRARLQFARHVRAHTPPRKRSRYHKYIFPMPKRKSTGNPLYRRRLWRKSKTQPKPSSSSSSSSPKLNRRMSKSSSKSPSSSPSSSKDKNNQNQLVYAKGFPPIRKLGTIAIGDKKYPTDEWTNVPKHITEAVSRQLHLQPNHPISLTRKLIESAFPRPLWKYHNKLFPVVTTKQNFDSLNFPPDHPGRSRTDTYYINRNTVLRTHTSAHQADIFHANLTDGFLISADVYRRDAIDRSHYPVFHQMEGARMWDRNRAQPGADLADMIWKDYEALPDPGIIVEDPNPTFDPVRNPLQTKHHSAAECEAIAAHLKRSIENVVATIFRAAKQGATNSSPSSSSSSTSAENTDPSTDTPSITDEPLKVRWIEAYFPFTSPSWELEVFWQGDWLELLGCGVVNQDIPSNAGVPSQIGWAFGIGLERIAMLLYSIPDIRLFWSQDPRFLSQFSASKPIAPFVPFSKYPACYKDVSFWLPPTTSPDQTVLSDETQPPVDHAGSSAGGVPHPADSPATTNTPTPAFHENDVMEIVRDVAQDLIEDVRLMDEFTHPKTGRKSMMYRLNYRSLERTLTNQEANEVHSRVQDKLVSVLGVELR